QFENRELFGVSNIHRTGHVMRSAHQPYEPIDEVVHVAERASLRAFTVDRDIAAKQRLHNEIRNDASVVGMHAWPIGVEDTGDLDAQIAPVPIGEEQALRATLALVIAGPQADRIDVAPIILGLGMNARITIDLRGRRLQDLGVHALGKTEHIDRAMHTGFDRLHRVVLVMHRRGRAGEIVDLVDLDEERKGDVVADQLEVLVIEQRLHISARAGKEVVDAEDLRALSDQTCTKMGAEKACPAGDQNTLFEMHSRYFAVRGHYQNRGQLASSGPWFAQSPRKLTAARAKEHN